MCGQFGRFKFCLLCPDSQRKGTGASYDDIAGEIYHLRELKQQTDSDETVKTIQMEHIKELQDFIGQQENTLTEFDEKLVKRWVRRITV